MGIVRESLRGLAREGVRQAVSPTAIKERFQRRASRTDLPVGPLSVHTYDKPSGSWTRGTNTVVEITVYGMPMPGTQTEIPTGGLINRLVHGRARAGTFSGPAYRFEAEQDVSRAQAETAFDALVLYAFLGSTLSETPLTPRFPGRAPAYATFV